MDFIIYTASYGTVTSTTALCVNNLYQESKHKFDWKIGLSDALIGRSRCRACQHFLIKEDAPYMLFVDGDICFKSEDIDKLLQEMKEHHVVGGLYPVTGAVYLASNNVGRPLNITGGVQEIDYLATGFMGISRVILERMRDELELPLLHKGTEFECYPFFESGRDALKKIYKSEDYDFCDKVRAIGEKVYVHTGVQLGHEKTQIYWAQEAIRNTDSLAPNLLEDACEYFGRDISNEVNEAPSKVAEGFEKWKGKPEDYYRHNEDYVLDDIQLTMQPGYKKTRWLPLSALKGERIVDIGCGIGTIPMRLAQQGNKVVGYDINECAIDFANFRKKKSRIKNVRFTTRKPDYGKFNYVLAIDVLEHIEDLRDFLLDIGKKAKVGTRFYHYNSFKQKIPQHYDHSEKFNEYLKEAGFLPWNPWWAVKIRDG